MSGQRITPLPTRVARLIHDDHLYFGRSIAQELSGTSSFGELVAMAVCGRRVTPEDRGVIDDIAVSLTAGDPRIWPMKLIRVVAAWGSMLPAMAAGCVVLQTGLLGPATSGDAARNLIALGSAVDDALGDPAAIEPAVLHLLKQKKRLGGFGVAFRAVDERLVILREALERRGRTQGKYWQLSELFAQVVQRHRNVAPNIGLGSAAALLDLGFGPDEILNLTVALSEHLRVANAVEGAKQAPAVLQSLPDDRVRYSGVGPRVSPRRELGNRGETT